MATVHPFSWGDDSLNPSFIVHLLVATRRWMRVATVGTEKQRCFYCYFACRRTKCRWIWTFVNLNRTNRDGTQPNALQAMRRKYFTSFLCVGGACRRQPGAPSYLTTTPANLGVVVVVVSRVPPRDEPRIGAKPAARSQTSVVDKVPLCPLKPSAQEPAPSRQYLCACVDG